MTEIKLGVSQVDREVVVVVDDLMRLSQWIGWWCLLLFARNVYTLLIFILLERDEQREGHISLYLQCA